MKKWSGGHHKNSCKTDAQYCVRCGKKITGEKPTGLELNCATGQYRNEKMPAFDERESQGWFVFGSTCAERTLKERAAT